MRRGIIIWMLLLLTRVVVAQPVEELIKQAIAHNPGLKALQLEYSAAKEQANQVSDFPDPTIGFGIGVMPVETRLGAQRLRIGITQPIPWKGLLMSRKEVKEAQAEALAFKDDLKEIEIAYGIRIAYSALQFAEDRLSILDSKTEVIESIIEIAKSNQSSGKGRLSDVLLAQRSLEELESNREIIESYKREPTILVNRWIGNALNDTVRLVGKVDAKPFIETLESVVLQDHPYFKLIDSRLQASQKSIELTKLEAKPKLGIGFDYAMIDQRSNVPDLIGNGRDVIMPMGRVTIPIHTGRYESKRNEEKIRQQSYMSLKEEKLVEIQAEIQIALSKIEIASLEIDKYKGLKERTDQTIDLLMQNYAAESVDFTELLRLVDESIDYDLMIVKSDYDISVATASILKYIEK